MPTTAPLRRSVIASLLLAAALLTGCSAKTPTWTQDSPRPATWAQPVDQPGLPNLHRVDDVLFRGAQPQPQAFETLKSLGVRTVINLRAWTAECAERESAKLSGVRLRQNAMGIDDDDAIAFLKAVGNRENGPFFVHCMHGADRTGTMIAVYRVVVQGWTKDEAIEEMVRGGYGYHTHLINLVRYLQNLDVEALRRNAGLTATAEASSSPSPSMADTRRPGTITP